MLYLYVDGVTLGPFSKQEVAARWSQGSINGMTLFRTLESDHWMHLASIARELGQPPFAATPYAQAAATRSGKLRRRLLTVACTLVLLGTVDYFFIPGGHPILSRLGLLASLAGLACAALSRLSVLW